MKVLPLLRADRRGYVLGDERIDGFADPEQSSFEVRLKVARWAARLDPDHLTDAQRALLSDQRAERLDADAMEELSALADNSDELQRLQVLGLFDQLSESQCALVRDPSSHPELRGRRYPLGIGEMRVLTGATDRQLRHWTDNGLVPAARVKGRRVFYSGGLARALLLAEAEQYQKTAVGALSKGGEEGARLMRLVGTTMLDSVVPRLPDEARDEMAAAAMAMLRHSRSVGELGPRP